MYIHSYQIHNVLNVYRKQLSQGAGTKGSDPMPAAPKNDRVELSANFQRQSLIDQVSAEIVDRIAQGGPQRRFEEAFAQQMNRSTGTETGRTSKREVEFTYTVIDENNRKITNTLPVENFSPLTGQPTQVEKGGSS
ncbi:MAG: DVU0524 family FlgM-associated protein [Desulfatitalea sp.]